MTDKLRNINCVFLRRGATLVLATMLWACAHAAPTLNFRVVAMHPHDVDDFTQGLIFHDGRLFESVGGYGRSAIIEKNLHDGTSLQHRALLPEYFGEGLTMVGERLLQLTWTSGAGLIYDRALKPLGRFRYRGEGWGLAHDGQRLILSDGSARLRFLNRDNFAETGSIAVHDGGRPVALLNELEYARGHLWANVWHSDRIAMIDVATGRVRAWLDLAVLRAQLGTPPKWDAAENVLNGIAYDAPRDRFLVTGKRWPTLFEIAIEPIE